MRSRQNVGELNLKEVQRYLVAPAGTPITLGELVRTLTNRINQTSHFETLSSRIQRLTGQRHCYFLSSGRAAQTLLLESMKEFRPNCNEVILPAYTCYSVAAAAVRAGLKIRLVDVNLETFDFDLDALESQDLRNAVAIVGCNLFGVMNSWKRLQPIAESDDVPLIDDGAQSFGAKMNGQVSGTFGMAGFYSLGRGKALTTYNGGILITDNSELARLLAARIAALRLPGLLAEALSYLKLTLYAAFIRPRLYWIPASLPFLGIGETIFETEFDIARLSRVQAAAAAVVLENVLFFNRMRAANAYEIGRLVLESGDFKVPGWLAEHCPPYLRLPVLAPTQAFRDRAISSLRRRGIAATRMYPSSMKEIPGIGPHLVNGGAEFPRAQSLVERLFTLPTHPLLTDADIESIAVSLREV